MLSRIDHDTELAVIDMSSEWVALDAHIPQDEFLLHDKLDTALLAHEQEVDFSG